MVMKFKEFFKNELFGCGMWEKLWIILSIVVIVGLSVYWKDNLVGICS